MPNQKTHTDFFERPPWSPDLKTIEHIWNVLEQETGNHGCAANKFAATV